MSFCVSTQNSPPTRSLLSSRAAWLALWLSLPLLMLALGGCSRANSKEVVDKNKKAGPPLPEVFFELPDERTFTDSEEFVGRLESSELVQLRARVSGYLEKVLFKDGADVNEGDLLAVIDARTYKADYDRALASVEQAKARGKRLLSELERSKQLFDQKVISQQDYDLHVTDYAEAQAALKLAEATAEISRLNIDFTEIRSPMKGKISRRLVDPGNLVKADDTVIAVMGSVDPMYAYFEIDERTVLRLRQMILAGDLPLPSTQRIEIGVTLADDKAYPIKGVIDFTDFALDSHTGTLRARAIIDNSSLLLIPGLIVRCRMPIGEPHKGLFVPEEALGSDQGQRFLYVLNDKDEVVYRRVTVGMQAAGWRAIEGDLHKDERIIVSGLQRVRAGQKVDPKPNTRPVAGSAAAAAASAAPAPPKKEASAAPAPAAPKH